MKNSNIVVLATHGGYYIPPSLKPSLADDFRESRLLKNFSDFATQFILPQNIPFFQKITAPFSRALGDPNRSPEAHDFWRDYDFGGNKIWKKSLTSQEKKKIFDAYYNAYHNAIMQVLSEVENREETVLVFDIHDTGNLLLGKNRASDQKRKQEVPLINLGDKYGTSCSPKVLQDCAYLLEKIFGEKPTLNEPYSGGYVTTHYGKNHNEKTDQKFKRNVLQIEFNRSLYMDEKNQEVDFEKAENIKSKLEKVMDLLGEKYALKKAL